jgi:phenylalanyl-tRNA synthetase alpha chain
VALPFTSTQKQRLIELDAEEDLDRFDFATEEERDRSFREIHKHLVSKNKQRLQVLRQDRLRPAIRKTESALVKTLNDAGFVEVVTPTTLSKGMLTKMGITEEHPFRKQLYWLESRICLRPMLAPNLYYLLGHVARIWPCPIRIFEVGQCFRKESKGSKHLSEFTMLNVVEMGIEGDPKARLEEMADLIMDAVGLDYQLHTETSEVYGKTIDVVVDGLEIASGAIGPHPLDANWDIAENWAGLGVGLERLVMLKEGFRNIRRAGRSLIYMDGARLNI